MCSAQGRSMKRYQGNMKQNLVNEFTPNVLEIFAQWGCIQEPVCLGAGEQSVCYGAGDVAVLINQGLNIPDVRQTNSYPLQQWMTAQAVRARVKTAEILAVGDHPFPYALMRRAYGINAATIKEAPEAQRAEWFRRMGAEVRKINGIQTEGFGEFVPTEQGGYRGRYPTWSAYLDACIARYLFQGRLSQEERSIRDLFLAQSLLSRVDLEKIAARLEAAKNWGTQSVLIHYDNRLANLIVEDREITLIDWGLAYAGIGLPQELIKVTEAPPASPEYSPMSAFLQGYGVAEEEWAEAIERGRLMLVLDGLAMSYAWAGASDPNYLGGIRGWLQSIKNFCDAMPY